MAKIAKKPNKGRVLVGISGGVDSAVSAYLLQKAGYQVEGAFMKNWSSTTGLKLAECPWLADRQEALRVAAFLGIPLHTLDFEKQYQDTVMKYFFTEYQAGRTPNPDVMCNKEIKFKLLYNWAMKNGFEYLATGHYAQIAKQSGISNFQFPISKQKSKTKNPETYNLEPTAYNLLRSADEFKDQTYFIYNIKTEQLPHVLFPIGGMKKPEVKKLAKKIGLPNATRKESMGLCFVGKIRLKDFLEQKVRAKPGPIIVESGKWRVESGSGPSPREERLGEVVVKSGATSKVSMTSSNSSSRGGGQEQGCVLGTHAGLHNYTIGQRQGINVGAGGPYYVVRKDLAKNTLYVTTDPNDPALEVSETVIHSVNWILPFENWKLDSKFTPPSLPLEKGGAGRRRSSPVLPLSKGELEGVKLLARYRHQGELVPCTVEKVKRDQYLVKFKTPQKALASGQSIVFYSGKVCLGGGVIV